MQQENSFVIYGNIIYATAFGKVQTYENAYLVCENGVSAGVFKCLPDQYKDIAVYDHSDKVVIPGMVDLHLHAPQFAFRGMGTDLELLEWLETYTFPEEIKYRDLGYAEMAYDRFAHALKKSYTTRAVIFGTIHKEATLLLAELLEKSGICSYVGKVNMDRNSPDGLLEDTDVSLRDTEDFIELMHKRFTHTRPIITPRFVPTCSDALLLGLGALAKRYDLPVQSHLSENIDEIEWVKSLHPDTTCYADVYRKYNLLNNKTVMAHCVHPTNCEVDMMLETGMMVAHCPGSNLNLSSGIAPIRRLTDMGINVGLGTDVAGGLSISMTKAVSDAMQMSKLYWFYNGKSDAFLTVAEAFSLATIEGGRFFGKVGSFEPGYAFDAVVVADERLGETDGILIERRLERIMHLGTFRHIAEKYVDGRRVI